MRRVASCPRQDGARMIRKVASESREFWERFAPWASQSWLTKYLPPSSGGLSMAGWQSSIRRARSLWPELDWYAVSKGCRFTPPEEKPPEPVYVDEVPHEGFEQAPATEIELTTEEKVVRDAEVRKLRARVADLEGRYDAAHEDLEIVDRLTAALDSRIPSMPPVKAPTILRRVPGKPESVVALVSDYHIGERVDFEETGGLNHYDFETFMQRWQYHVDGIGGITLGKLTGYEFPELRIIALGDMVSGIIHDELVETSDSTLMDWLIDGASVIAQGIRQLACEFPSVKVDWHFGNHGRVTQKPRFKRRWVNYDYLMGHMVSLHLADQPNIEFVNHKSFWSLLDVQGHGVLNLHGDNIKGWNGLPSYGINRTVGNLQALLQQRNHRFKYVNLGHFHQSGLIERMDCDIILNSSAIGANEFSIGALFAGSKPRQVIYGMHPDKGQTWLYRLDLTGGGDHECRFTI